MPQPAVDKRVRASVFVMLGEDAPPTTKEIKARLVSEADAAAKVGRPWPFKPPSERTIRRLREEYGGLKDEERSQYDQLKWPETLELGVAITGLPWEASAAILELTAFVEREAGLRTTIRQGKWFWRITLAAPDAPLLVREYSSWALASHEERGPVPEEELRKVEWFLAFAPWRSDKNRQSYEAAIDKGAVPQPVLQTLLDPHLVVEVSQDLRDLTEFTEGAN